MDWFYTLEAPVQVAIVGVLSAIITAAGAYLVAKANGSKPGKPAELAAVSLDNSGLKLVAAALEGVNVTLIEQNRIMREQGRDASKAIEELAQELRHQGENLRK